MPLRPTSRLVTTAWLRLAVPDVVVGDRLPKLADLKPTEAAGLRENGFVRLPVVGGSPDRDVPMRAPVVTAECWLPPPAANQRASWARVEQLAERIVAATYDHSLRGLAIDLSSAGDYAPAVVHTVLALGEPQRVEDPNDWTRVDVDLQIAWTA